MDNKQWHICEMCGKGRWVVLRHGQPRNKLCLTCSQHDPARRRKVSIALQGERSHFWAGGINHKRGYLGVKLSSDDPFFCMVNKMRYVLEHRLVIAKSLGRPLYAWEVVHHKNGIKNDNRIENLELLPNRGKHNTMLEKEIKRQAKLIRELQGRVTLLESELVLVESNGDDISEVKAEAMSLLDYAKQLAPVITEIK